MKRTELLKVIAAVLPFGAIAMIPEPVEPKTEPAPRHQEPAEVRYTGKTRWLMVHPGDRDTLPWFHERGKPCRVCDHIGVPSIAWYDGDHLPTTVP